MTWRLAGVWAIAAVVGFLLGGARSIVRGVRLDRCGQPDPDGSDR